MIVRKVPKVEYTYAFSQINEQELVILRKILDAVVAGGQTRENILKNLEKSNPDWKRPVLDMISDIEGCLEDEDPEE
jgi:hypothetical protein